MNAADLGHIDEAGAAIRSARSIVDCLTDCTQIDKNSSAPEALYVVMDILVRAENAVNAIGRTA